MKINKGIVIQKKGKTSTIFDGEKSILFTLNDTATFIFSCLKLDKKTEEIAKFMVKKYKITPDVATKDIRDFITELKKKKIVSES